MGICSKRYFMLSLCILQMVTIIQRQVFDFLGFLWIPILINFFEVIFTIFGFFGAFQYRSKYILSYSIWNLFCLGWNIFMICLYLDVGVLNHKESKVLKIDPDSGSWWRNGPGCKGVLNITSPIPLWENVTNCLVDYRYVEVFQAGLQCILSVIGSITGFCLIKLFMEEDDSFNYMGGSGKGPQHLALQPMYVNESNFNTNSSNSSYRNKMHKPFLRSNNGEQSLGRDSFTHKNKSAVRTDQIRYQGPIYRTHSYNKLELLPSYIRENKNRPKSMCFD